MANVNKIIQEELEKYPKDISKLCIEAIRKAEDLPLASLIEDLDTAIRNMVKRSEINDSTSH